MELPSLLTIKEEDLTEEQLVYVQNYYKYLPILNNNCTMNKICRYMETQIEDVKLGLQKDAKDFDKKILKQGRRREEDKIEELRTLYKEYRERLSDLYQTSLTVKTDKDDMFTYRNIFRKEFEERAREIVKDEVALCNMIVDICYESNNTTKQFAWDVCRKQLIKNLKRNKESK